MEIEDSLSFPLEHFTKVLELQNSKGLPYFLIGGQAVNYWAEHYISKEPKLNLLKPFTSKDIDFKGELEDLKRIASQLNCRLIYPHPAEMTSLAGVIEFRMAGKNAKIEVVRKIPGVSPSAEKWAVETEWNGKKIRVLDPVSLFSCKLALATKLAQQDRQDINHLKIMFLCVRSFLEEFLENVEKGHLPVRGWLGAANQVTKLATTTSGRKASRLLGVNWPEILPMEAICKSDNKSIVQFREKQLLRWKAG